MAPDRLRGDRARDCGRRRRLASAGGGLRSPDGIRDDYSRESTPALNTANPDVAIIGAGIVGLATAMALADQGAVVTLMEKEDSVGVHQTGHNSGVIHTGIYYRPGSHKARFCVEGRRHLLEFAQIEGIPTAITGKVIVATKLSEITGLEELHRRAMANGVDNVTRLTPSELRDVEPEAAGVAALNVPGTGVIDFKMVAAAMRRRVEGLRGEVRTGVRVIGAVRHRDTWSIDLSDSTQVRAPKVVVCAGLQGDRVARLFGLAPDVRIVPFRGEYWQLRRPHLVRSLIYPVPDPLFPFLGVHFTKGMSGQVEVGPNAVLAFAREGYSWGAISPRELVEILGTPGLGRLVRKYWRIGGAEMIRSLIPTLLVNAARALVPAVSRGDLARAGTGVRAQALSPDGSLVDDFVFAQGEGVLSVISAPSPGATASISIGREVASRL
jgi:L-2-hydroxyglutarate oxidase